MDFNLLSSPLYSSQFDGLLRSLLPEGVCAHLMPLVVSNRFRDDLLLCGIRLGELNQGAVLKRQCEYLAGRYCAKQSLLALEQSAGLALLDKQVGTGSSREPLWPSDILGSISHSRKYAMAVVVPEGAGYLGIGVDIEECVDTDFAPVLAEQIMTASELACFNTLENMGFAEFVTLVFSAKEALFKALFPTVKRYLDFDSSELIGVDQTQQRLQFRLTSCVSHACQKDMILMVHFEYLTLAKLSKPLVKSCLTLVLLPTSSC